MAGYLSSAGMLHKPTWIYQSFSSHPVVNAIEFSIPRD